MKSNQPQPTKASPWPKLGSGLGLRHHYWDDIFSGALRADWWEVISETYMTPAWRTPGRALDLLLKVRQDFPVVCHGVSMSIGAADGVDLEYLKLLKNLIDVVEPAVVSDHLCWTRFGAHNSHDLLPLPYTEESIRVVSENILRAQDFLKRRLVFENVSSYVEFSSGTMTEWEFISEIVRRSGCGLLLDVNNIFVSGFNHKYDPRLFLQGIASGVGREPVAQIHLAGHSRYPTHIVDTHDEAVCEEVWALFGQALEIFGEKNCMIERDDQFPEVSELQTEFDRMALLVRGARMTRRSAVLPSAEIGL